MAGPIDVSVIIATSLEASRVDVMLRAVESILSQAGCSAVPIIVVNGDRYDIDALQYWKTRGDVRLFQLEEGDQTKARLFGRKQVDSEFFGALDDDDVYLPGGLRTRLAPMWAERSVDVVVGNGLLERDGRESIHLTKLEMHRKSPLLGLASENWLPSSCAAIFRTATIGVEYFEQLDRWMEWTAVAFRLALNGRRIVFLDDLTFRITDPTNSLSKSVGYAMGVPETLRQLLNNPLPRDAKRIWGRKYGAALHGLAALHLSRGERRLAWKAHIQSLLCPGGQRYMLFSRKLLGGSRPTDGNG